jgi:hypothetical protein
MSKRTGNGVMIGIITAGSLQTHCVQSLLKVVEAKAAEEIVIRTCGPYLDMGRNNMVEIFRNEYPHCDRLLFVDSDIGFTPEHVQQLVDDDLPIVAGVYHSLYETGIHPIVHQWVEEGGRMRLPLMKKWNRPEDEHLVPVDGVGAGFLMIHRSVVDKFAAIYGPPQIWFGIDHRAGVELGEDLTFCVRANDLGIPVVVDRRVQVAHQKSLVLQGPYNEQP